MSLYSEFSALIFAPALSINLVNQAWKTDSLLQDYHVKHLSSGVQWWYQTAFASLSSTHCTYIVENISSFTIKLFEQALHRVGTLKTANPLRATCSSSVQNKCLMFILSFFMSRYLGLKLLCYIRNFKLYRYYI